MATDAELIVSARRGSEDALEALFRRYWPLAWQWAYALTGSRTRADDLAQEAFARAIAALPRFDAERPSARPYKFVFLPQDGAPPYAFWHDGGNLPPGLKIEPDGTRPA